MTVSDERPVPPPEKVIVADQDRCPACDGAAFMCLDLPCGGCHGSGRADDSPLPLQARLCHLGLNLRQIRYCLAAPDVDDPMPEPDEPPAPSSSVGQGEKVEVDRADLDRILNKGDGDNSAGYSEWKSSCDRLRAALSQSQEGKS